MSGDGIIRLAKRKELIADTGKLGLCGRGEGLPKLMMQRVSIGETCPSRGGI